MIGADVVGDEVEHEPEPTPGEPLALPRLRRRAGLPGAQRPGPVEPVLRDLVELRVREVIEGGGAAQAIPALAQQDPRVELVEHRVAPSWLRLHGRRHVSPPASTMAGSTR